MSRLVIEPMFSYSSDELKTDKILHVISIDFDDSCVTTGFTRIQADSMVLSYIEAFQASVKSTQ